MIEREREPVTTLSAFSSDNAVPTGWEQGRTDLQDAEVYWLSTVRPDGRPHVTPLLGIWLDRALYFCTGSNERKAKNLAQNPHCILTTGCNRLDGLDIVVEGDVAKVSDVRSLALEVARLHARSIFVLFDIATRDLAKHSQSGGQFFGINASNDGRIMIFAGGIPLKRGGEVVGAIGVSGGSGEQDHLVAEAGADAL